MDFFTITDSNGNIYKLTVIGFSVGPHVTASAKIIHFEKKSLGQAYSKLVKLKNTSKLCAAIFLFDDDGEQIFTVYPREGTINPGKSLNVQISFVPTHTGRFARILPCLIMYQSPILLHLFGVVEEESLHHRTERLSLQFEDTVGFPGYMSDAVSFQKDTPNLSVTKNFLDFGQYTNNDLSCPTQLIGITNNMSKPVTIKWPPAGIFSVNPGKITIPPSGAALFECKFRPTELYKLYYRQIFAEIYAPASVDNMNVPYPICVNMIGHTFPDKQQWIPNIEVTPPVVLLPITVPNHPTWTTFILKSHGNLPILYKLMPPTNTNFIMKPMVGLIRNYQIVVAQLHTIKATKSSFMEVWQLQANGYVMGSLVIYVKAQSDIPEVRIGTDNEVHLGSALPGCSSFAYVAMSNTSNVPFKFSFLIPPNAPLDITPKEGYLYPNEETFITAKHHTETEGDSIYNAICQLQAALNEDFLVGAAVDQLIKFYCTCYYAELCAVPNYFHAGTTVFGSTVTTKFYLHNFGISPVFFSLNCLNKMETNVKTVFVPESGTCCPQEKILITCKFVAEDGGQQIIKVGYYLRTSIYSDIVLYDKSAVKLYEVEFDCCVPNLQVVEIVEHNFGYLFGKSYLWNRFKIDKINVKLQNILLSHADVMEIALPHFEISRKEFYIIFLMKNSTDFEIPVALKRKKLCECKPTPVKNLLSLRKTELKCPHIDILKMEISSSLVAAHSSTLMTLKVKYVLPLKNLISYIVKIGDNCYFEFIFAIDPIIKPPLRPYSPHKGLDMGFIYIGLQEPPLQAYWVYNNTSSPLKFHLDDKKIKALNAAEDFEIFRCYNLDGVVSPFSRTAILFRFWPIEEKKYQLHIPMYLGKEYINFLLEGTGVGYKIRSISQKEDIMKICTQPRPPINHLAIVSSDNILVKPFLVYNVQEILIFLKNIDDKCCIAYSWRPFFIDGVIKVEYLNEKEVLKPKESHSVILKIISLNEPCSLEFDVFCELLNITQLAQHKESVRKAQEKLEIKTQAFEIGSQGDEKYYEPKSLCTYPIIPPPEPFFVSVHLSVHILSFMDRDIPLENNYELDELPQRAIVADTLYKSIEQFYNNSEHLEVKIPLAIDDQVLQSTLNTIAMEAIYSQYFHKIFKTISSQTIPQYNQIRIYPNESRCRSRSVDRLKTQRELKKRAALAMLNKPDLQDIDILVKDIVLNALHSRMKLGTRKDSK